MDLQQAFKGAKIIETIENYGLAQETVSREVTSDKKLEGHYYYSDEQFWQDVIRTQDHLWGQQIDLHRFVVSDWVARVPGLYWTEAAKFLRVHKESDIAFQSNNWIEFNPPGKSDKVLGGVGTLLLPPTDEGKRLISVSSSCNASTGIPVLIFPEVMNSLKIKQGDCVSIKFARWQPMDIQWSKQFASSKDIPRGYLIVDDIKNIIVYRNDYPVVYHPFSIMEYQNGDALLYDFVYVTADSKVNNVDVEIEKFFDIYKNKEGRNGNYLLNPNMVNPIFESRYSCPSELQHVSEKAKLKLLYQRVRDVHFNNVSIDLLINELTKYYQTSVSIRNLAKRIGINSALLSEDSAASMSSQLISLCIEQSQTETLIDRMIYEYQEIFK